MAKPKSQPTTSKSKPLLIIVLAVIVAGGAALYMSKQSTSTTAASAPSTSPSGSLFTPAGLPVPGGGRVRGPQNAPVTLVEYGDYQCPSCGYFAPIVQEVLKRNPTQVKLEFHHFPLVGMHQFAMPAALAAEAAGEQGKFWEMHDLIYQNQEAWSRMPNAETEFVAFAGRLGLNMDQFMRDMRAPETQTRILQDVVRARDAQINETPTFFINGVKVDPKPNNADDFSRLIQDKLPK